MRHFSLNYRLIIFALLISLLPLSSSVGRHYLLVLESDDLKENSPSSIEDDSLADEDTVAGDSSEWDEFGDYENKSDEELDPGSWRPIFEGESAGENSSSSSSEGLYISAVRNLVSAASSGEPESMGEAVAEMEALAVGGYPHAQSVLGFFYGAGCGVEQSASKALLYHHFAAEGGNSQSKMALAYIYYRQEMYEKAVKLYAELAETAVASFLISKDTPVIEPVRINEGAEENTEALRKSRGEEDDDFQIMEYQAQKGNPVAMYKLGIFYYFGFRGVRRDHAKALSWFLKAVQKGEPKSMELLGEIYARGAGVERNYTKALEWLKLASKQRHYSAYNGIGYLYVKGYGVEKKNYTKAKEYFEKAAANEEAGGHYNLGVLYLKGIGVKRDAKLARNYFITAANFGQPKAFYQLAKMFQKGIGLRKNLATVMVKGTVGYWYIGKSNSDGDILSVNSILVLRPGRATGLHARCWEIDVFPEDSMHVDVSHQQNQVTEEFQIELVGPSLHCLGWGMSLWTFDCAHAWRHEPKLSRVAKFPWSQDVAPD